MHEKDIFEGKKISKIFFKAFGYTLLCLSLVLIGFFAAKLLWGNGF